MRPTVSAPSRAWKTYASRGFSEGDTVLFKRGSVFRGVLHTRNGTDQAPITYGAYGEGDKPVFLGSVPANEPEHWVQERPSVWRYTGTFPSEVCNVVFNNGESCGILRWRIEDLQQPGDWHYTGIGMHSADGGRGDPDGVLYLCSAANPGAAYASIECVLWGAAEDGRWQPRHPGEPEFPELRSAWLLSSRRAERRHPQLRIPVHRRRGLEPETSRSFRQRDRVLGRGRRLYRRRYPRQQKAGVIPNRRAL